jgi:hypothetical protein
MKVIFDAPNFEPFGSFVDDVSPLRGLDGVEPVDLYGVVLRWLAVNEAKDGFHKLLPVPGINIFNFHVSISITG